MHRSYRILNLAPLVFLLLAGCGGGGGGGSKAVKAVPAKFSLAWGARSRAIEAPSSALSATVMLAETSATGENIVTTLNRSASPQDYTGEYTTPEAVEVGAHVLMVRFFAGPDGTGDIVGEGIANVTISPDGSGIGEVAVNQAVASVEIVPGQVVPVGTQAQLLFTARHANGSILALAPGSAIWSKESGSGELTLTPDGIATAVALGEVNVEVKVDGITSPAASVLVSP